MRVYIAGPYRARIALQHCAAEAERIGYTSTARWLTGDHEGQPDAATDAPVTDRERWAREDLADIDKATVMIAFTAEAARALPHVGIAYPPDNAAFGASGGRHIETGYAIANGKTVVLVGEPENVFHWMPSIKRAETWHDATLWLARHLVDTERHAPRAVPA